MTDKVTSTYVSRVGRLGNSLFQIAATIGYGKDYDKKPVFTKWDYQDYIELELIENFTTWTREAEGGLSYKPLNFHSGNVNLEGHFLSENYFKNHRDEVLKTIKLRPEWDKYINDKYGKLLERNTCSIHVRRTDYLQPDQMKTHGVLPLMYYGFAVEKIKADKYLVFSDDMAWCKENLQSEKITYIEGEKDIIDLFLMSKCKNHIIANSTFSWWASWLSGNKTVAPKNFFVDGYSWEGLYKKDWVII